MKALTIAATGMNAQQLNLEVIANNIANINTTGFKRARAEFTDLLYQSERTAGVPNQANQAIVPEGALVGLGVQTAAVAAAGGAEGGPVRVDRRRPHQRQRGEALHARR